MNKNKYIKTIGTSMLASLLTLGQTYESPVPKNQESTIQTEYHSASRHNQESRKNNYVFNNPQMSDRNKILGGLELRTGSSGSEPVLNLTDDITLLATLVYEEARGCSSLEKTAVIYTVMNRKRLDSQNRSLLQIVLKDYQYSCFNNYDPIKGKNPKINRKNEEEWKECINIAKGVLEGKYSDPTNGATHYFNPDKATPSWPSKLKMVTMPAGTQHKFYK